MGRRHIMVNNKKVYLLPAEQRDALMAAKPQDVRWAECDARTLEVADLDVLKPKLGVKDKQKLDAALLLANKLADDLDHCDRAVIYCVKGCERTSTVAALLLRVHGKPTPSNDAVMAILRTAYGDEPQFAHQYSRRPDTHLAAYEKAYK